MPHIIYQFTFAFFKLTYAHVGTLSSTGTLGTSDINYYSVSTAGTVGCNYPLLSIDGADGN
jgi:hypothetical protein